MALTRWPVARLGRRGSRALVAGVALAAVATGTAVWYAGRDDRALHHACDGVLAVHEVRSVLGEGDVSVTAHAAGSFGGTRSDLSVRCAVSAAGTGSVAVSIVGVPRPTDEFVGESGTGDGDDGALYPSVPSGTTLPVPLGHGWSGLFGTDNARPGDSKDGRATTAVLLTCQDHGDSGAAGTAAGGHGGGAGRRDRGLLVTATTALHGVTLDDPATRPRFVRTALATAQAANRHWHCGADTGTPVTTLGLPVNKDEYRPLLGADGTCAGVPTADRSEVSTARETARDRAPREVCGLGSRDGTPRYRLDAYYGPYAEDDRAQYAHAHHGGTITPDLGPAGRLGESAYWASASCPGAEPALYTVRADGTDQQSRDEPDLGYERRALAAFAARSASEHGCARPKLPTP